MTVTATAFFVHLQLILWKIFLCSFTFFNVNVYDTSIGRKLKGSSSYTIVKEDKTEENTEIKKTEDSKTTAAVTAPAKVNLKKLVSKHKKQMTAVWSKNTKVSGFQIVYSTNKAFKKNVKRVNVNSNKAVSKTIKKLKSHKNYYVKVRAFNKKGSKTVYGMYSFVKKVRVR